MIYYGLPKSHIKYENIIAWGCIRMPYKQSEHYTKSFIKIKFTVKNIHLPNKATIHQRKYIF